MKRSRVIRITRWSILVGGALVLEVITRTGLVRPSRLTPVSEMFSTLWKFIVTGDLQLSFLKETSVAANFFYTFGEILISFSLAVILGIPVGILLWKYKTLARILNPYLVSYYAIPVFALYPVLIAFMGLGMVSITFMGWLMAIVAIIINTSTGFDKVDETIYPKVGESFRLSRFKIFFRIYFPAATPYMFSGLKLGFIYAMIGVIASEFILSTQGLGHLVAFSYNSFETKIMYASILLIVIIAVFVNEILMRTEAYLYGRRAK